VARLRELHRSARAAALTDIVGNHYGVAVEASERNGWGQWHRADEKGVGMDRTVATGTGYVGQYAPAVSQIYESLANARRSVALHLHCPTPGCIGKTVISTSAIRITTV
jgi:alpha-glucuronidase